MRILHPLHPLRALLAAGFLLSLTTADAQAASTTVFWDNPPVGTFAAGWGVSQATAQSANAAGIPIIAIPSIAAATDLGVANSLDYASRVIPLPFGSAPATVTSNWSATNNTGLNAPGDPVLDNLYLVFARPGPHTITINGQPQSVTYDPADVGLDLSFAQPGLADWVLLQVPSDRLVPTSIPVYYPAVSLGTLPTGSTLPFQLFYTIDNPQVLNESINVELGMPQWTLFFASTVVPEPSSALLLMLGLGALAVARRERS